MNETHVGENAELYALGSLTDDERACVDAHIATCAQCRARVGVAEETVLALEAQTPTVPLRGASPTFGRKKTPRWWMPAAVAAALVVGFVLPHPQGEQPAQVAMLHSHFNHAQFTGNGPLAKVLYARDGSWYYIVVEGTHRYSVVGSSGQLEVPLGTTAARGATSELFVRGDKRFAHIDLREGTRTVETAQIR